MQIVVIGAGAMGAAVVHYLLRDHSIQNILLIDNNKQQLISLKDRLNAIISTKKLSILCIDVNEQKIIIKAIKNYNIVIGAVPWPATVKIIKAALAVKIPFVSITRPHYTELAALEPQIIKQQGTIMLGCGLEPGLTEICAHTLAVQFAKLDTLHIYCGGIPLHPIPPLFYKSTFTNNRLPIDPRSAYFIEQGQLKKAPRFSAVENISIKDIGTLEAWHDGMLPWLIELPNLKQATLCTQKTLRWPGFANKINLLAEFGLLSNEPIKVNDQLVVPKQVLEALLKPSTTFNEQDRDVVVLKLVATGLLKNNTQYTISALLIDKFDEVTGFSAMARTTGYTAAICACLLASTSELPKGLIRPEQFFHADKFKQSQAKLAEVAINIRIG